MWLCALFFAVVLPANELTPAERGAGWSLLFDGHSWANWTLSQGAGTTWWKIEDGWMRSLPVGASAEGRRLTTLESYEDFELSFTWKIDREGNSGVKYRIQGAWQFQPQDLETGAVTRLPPTLENLRISTALGFEYQLADDENTPDALDSPARSAAALYRLVAPRKAGPVKAGTVHTSRIKVVGSRFEHWLDGGLVAEGDLAGEGLRGVLRQNRAKGEEKFAGAGGVRQPRYDGLLERVTAEALLAFEVPGSPIDLQHHRSGVWFRAVKIRRL
ncbi:MAG: DUF1080 domain-containing protein [Acidobacteria bacterium]|nr:DUF1080 domain-containing protein [Acidobacteriota bacterium]